MKRIPLTQGKFAIVDNKNYEWLNQWKWYFKLGYATRNIDLDNKKRKTLFMHRLINNTPDGFETDHINRNKLDNRKENLRTVTHSQNVISREKQSNNTSGHTGIFWYKDRQKWVASIVVNKKQIYLGSYSKIGVAWLARRWGERLYHGEFARLNTVI